MLKNDYKVIGVMSGTSLDGIDLAELQFNISDEGSWRFDIINSETIAYTNSWKVLLKEAISYSEEKIKIFDLQYTKYLAVVISEFIKKRNIKNLDAVCSHGHTIWHRPKDGITLQIGNLPILARSINQRVVCDFRVQDVQLGGQGAPLVPIGDRLLFRKFDYCLNLGGFANISYERDKKRVAYDICPVNIVLNHYSEKTGNPFDEGGRIASSGELISDLLQKLNKLSFYSENPPKSLGLEWVKEHIFSFLDDSSYSLKDILHTFTEHIAMQLASQFSKGASVLITGGGVYNDFLINRLNSLSQIDAEIPSSEIIEYKEALIFGLLGILKLRESINCLASVTGADKDHSSGNIFTF